MPWAYLSSSLTASSYPQLLWFLLLSSSTGKFPAYSMIIWFGGHVQILLCLLLLLFSLQYMVNIHRNSELYVRIPEYKLEVKLCYTYVWLFNLFGKLLSRFPFSYTWIFLNTKKLYSSSSCVTWTGIPDANFALHRKNYEKNYSFYRERRPKITWKIISKASCAAYSGK